MPNYSKTILYKIVCKDTNINDIYIGHTTNFNSRKNDHKKNCNNEKNEHYNLKVYQFIRNNGGFENWEIIKIEDYPCENKLEALKRENYLVKELKSSLNSDIPGRTYKEWYKDNKKNIAKKMKEYCEKNKEILAEKAKEYYEINKQLIAERMKEYREDNKEIIAKINKEYREKNKEILAKKNKEYLEKNKEEIYAKINEKITCECGCKISKRNISTHRKSQKHLSLLKLETDGNTN